MSNFDDQINQAWAKLVDINTTVREPHQHSFVRSFRSVTSQLRLLTSRGCDVTITISPAKPNVEGKFFIQNWDDKP